MWQSPGTIDRYRCTERDAHICFSFIENIFCKCFCLPGDCHGLQSKPRNDMDFGRRSGFLSAAETY